MLDWSEAAPAAAYRWVLRGYSQARLADYITPPANLVVSNVRGPDHPLYVAGARLRRLYSVGPPVEGIGLNVTAWSYMDELNVGLLACRDAVPALWELADGLRDSLGELRKAVEAGAGAQ